MTCRPAQGSSMELLAQIVLESLDIGGHDAFRRIGAARRGGSVHNRSRPMLRIASFAGLVLAFGCAAIAADSPVAPTPVKIAVFDFEMVDNSPAAELLNEPTSAADSMRNVSQTARQALAQSGRYSVLDVSAIRPEALAGKKIQTCDGCEAGIALALGADQSLIGILQRATQTDYYIMIRIRDARTGQIVNEQSANFAGSEEGWPSGVRMLIKHQILIAPQ